VSEFSPKSSQKILSYVVGWLCVLGWQTGAASSAFLAGIEVQSLIVLNHPSYDAKPWHGTLIVIAIAAVCGLFNTLLARKLPLVEGTVLILHILGFFAILVPLVVLAPRSSVKEVFFTFNNGVTDPTGNRPWSSTGVACLVGIIGPTVSLLGSDAATHMSEELQDASYTLPRAMIATGIFNGALGLAMLIAFCFCLGDVPKVMEAPVTSLGFPFIQVFANATDSVSGATMMTSILIVLSSFCCITNIATASRQLFAFARDKGLPFSSFFAYVSSTIFFYLIITDTDDRSRWAGTSLLIPYF
jgi:choline transport protein